jgi:hypothetical protein
MDSYLIGVIVDSQHIMFLGAEWEQIQV